MLSNVRHVPQPIEILSYIADRIWFTGFESWIHNWIKRGWRTADGKPVKNKPLIQYLSALLNARAQAGQKVRICLELIIMPSLSLYLILRFALCMFMDTLALPATKAPINWPTKAATCQKNLTGTGRFLLMRCA